MAEKRISLEIPPGVYRNGTQLQSRGRWYDANGVRFLDKTVIEPIGGWRRAPNDAGTNLGALTGVPRGAVVWLDDSGSVFIGVGTTSKLYAIGGGVTNDVTPTDLAAGRTDTTQPGSVTLPGQGTSIYGQGPYGSGPYGQGSTLGVSYEATNWSLDTFGSYLVAVNTSDGRLLVWQGDPAVKAAPPTGSPTSLRGVVVTPERFIVALGADGNVRCVAWAAQETTDQWDVLPENSAGSFILTTEGRLLTGKRTRRETLLFTDTDIHTMTYIGGDLIYRFDQAGDKCGLIAPRAAVVVDTQAFWMGKKGFFSYDGFARPLPCDVHDYVFSDFNRTQSAKVWAMSVAEFGEVWWFYPSAGSTEVDRYVAYNYRENHWTIGQLARTAGVDASGAPYPIMLAPTGEIYEHEFGQTRTGMTPFLESGPIRLDEGDLVYAAQKLYPDEKTLGDVRATLYSKMSPVGAETTHGPFTASEETNVRFTARQARVRLDEATQTDWRVGTFQLGVIPAGRR